MAKGGDGKFIFFLGDRSETGVLNLGLHVCKAGVVPLKPHPWSTCLFS
jgi:hypothetical protein